MDSPYLHIAVIRTCNVLKSYIHYGHLIFRRETIYNCHRYFNLRCNWIIPYFSFHLPMHYLQIVSMVITDAFVHILCLE